MIEWVLFLILQDPAMPYVEESYEVYRTLEECKARFDEIVAAHKQHVAEGGEIRIRVECQQVETEVI